MSEYTAPVNFIDLAAQQSVIRDKIDHAISRVLDHGQYIMGPEVKEFENDLKLFTGVEHALTCANGTDALTLVMMAMDIGPGDAVFIPSFTYVASAETPAQLGATPFFVDVKKDTFNLCSESLKQAILDAREMSLNPSLLIAVDLFGQPADIKSIYEVTRNENIKVIVDSAQSFGACINQKKVGNFGDATTTSFFPAKPLGCYGDGGAVLTNDEELSHLVNSIRLHGKGTEKYDNVRIGVNSRLDTIQAAILTEKLKIFPGEIQKRNDVANTYNDGLMRNSDIITPILLKNTSSVWAQYTLRLNNRDKIKSELSKNNIPSVVYYPKSLTQQEGYKNFPIVSSGVKASDDLPSEVLSLPMHPYLKKDVLNKIIDIVSNEIE